MAHKHYKTHPHLHLLQINQNNIFQSRISTLNPPSFIFMDLAEKSSGAEVITVDIHAAKNLLNQGHRYLDVRTEEEFKNGHVENAVNIAYMFNTPQGRVKNPKFMDQALALFGKEDHLIVGCQSGVRSVYATTDLLHADFKHVYNMGGGYIAWVGSRLLTIKPQEKTSVEA